MTGYVYRGTQRLDEPSAGVCRGARGTTKGYGRHVRRGERPCDSCREAMNAYNRERRRKWESNPNTKAADRARRKAKARAWAALAKRHPEEYQALLLVELGRVHAELTTPSATTEARHAE